MPNYALTIEYDGTEFEGWQRQPAGHRSVQGVLEEALADLDGAAVIVRGAGRTDAGVHAEGQLAAAALRLDLPGESLVRAVNARLPADVALRQAVPAPEGWNPRFVKGWKRYRYHCWNGPLASPLRARRFAHVPRRLDPVTMQRAAKDLEGTHDFAAFQGRGSSITCTVRSLHELRVAGVPGGEITIEARGSGFLKHMVRNLAGTLIEVGLGGRAPDSMPELLASLDRRQAGRTAPAHGLVLVEVQVPLEAPPDTTQKEPPEG